MDGYHGESRRWSCHWLGKKRLVGSFLQQKRVLLIHICRIALIKQSLSSFASNLEKKRGGKVQKASLWSIAAGLTQGFLVLVFLKRYVSFKVHLGVFLSSFGWLFCMEDSAIVAGDWRHGFRWFNGRKDFIGR